MKMKSKESLPTKERITKKRYQTRPSQSSPAGEAHWLKKPNMGQKVKQKIYLLVHFFFVNVPQN